MEKCPKCNSVMKPSPMQDIEAKQGPGFFTVCGHCGSFFVFNNDMTLREPTEKDWKEIEEKIPGIQEHVIALQKEFAQLNEKHNPNN